VTGEQAPIATCQLETTAARQFQGLAVAPKRENLGVDNLKG
jgi:hypothetical protein